jgi:hypothetical protein
VISCAFNNKSVHFFGVIICVIVNMHGRTTIKKKSNPLIDTVGLRVYGEDMKVLMCLVSLSDVTLETGSVKYQTAKLLRH